MELNLNSNNNNNDNDQTDHNSTVNQEDINATYVTKTFVQRKFIINLNKLKQSLSLSPTELVLLGKGLTFIPTPTAPDLGEINNDLAYMFWRMRLKLHFADMESESDTSEFEKHLNIMFRNKSKWTPAANADVILDAFIEAVKKDFYNLKYQSYKQNPHKNITAEEAKALTHLKNNDNIIIKKTDKGAAVVVKSRDDYIKEGIRQLSDTNFYVKLDYDPTPNHIDEIHNTLLKALQRDEITKKIFEFLVPTDCTTPAWYFLPKIHKEKITGRPIVSGNNSPAEKNICLRRRTHQDDGTTYTIICQRHPRLHKKN